MKLISNVKLRTTLQMAFFHVLLFCCFFLYIFKYGNTNLIFHAFGRFVDYPLFLTGRQFFSQTVGHPGGIVEYLTGFLSQLYYYPLKGAIVITLVLALTCLAVGILASFSRISFFAGLAAYIPAIFFLAMHSRFEHHLGHFVALLINLWTLILYCKFPLKNLAFRTVLFAVLFILLYFAAGPCALVYGVLAAGFELLIRRRIISGFLCILLTALIPLAFGWHFDMGINAIYLYSLGYDPVSSLSDITSAIALQISVICILLAAFACNYFLNPNTSAKSTENNPTKTKNLWLSRIAQPVVVIIISVIAVSLSTDETTKHHLQADYYAANGMWTELLDYADRFPVVAYSPEGNHNIIQALHHTGRLADDIFRYPQFNEGMFLPAEREGVREYRRGISYIRLALTLGMVNLAEKEAYEMLENYGEYPETLWNLAMINLAKNQPETARVFLNVLEKDLLYADIAKSTLDRLSDDPALSNDKEIIRLRSVMQTADVTGTVTLEQMMMGLLKVNPKNKLAFEYLMLYYLKSKKLDKIAANIYLLENFGYKKMPRHIQEAILIHIAKTRGQVDAHGWQLEPRVSNNARQFMKTAKFNPPSRPGSKEILAQKFGSTYFFYHTYNQTGAGR